MMSAGYQERQTSGNWTPVEPQTTTLSNPFFEFPSPRTTLRVLPSGHPVETQGFNAFQYLEPHTTALVAEREAILTEIRKRYVLGAAASVEKFLFQHRVLPELLLQAEGPLRVAFGADTILSLRAPIDESGAQTLYAVAIWSGAVADAS